MKHSVRVLQLLTQNCGDDDDAVDEEAGEEPQHRKHHVGGGESAGDGEEHPKHVGHQQHNPSTEPGERQGGF